MISKAKQAELEQAFDLQGHLPVEVLKQIQVGDYLEVKWFDSPNTIALVIRVDHNPRVKRPGSFEFRAMDFRAPKGSYLEDGGTVTGDQVVAVRGNVKDSMPSIG